MTFISLWLSATLTVSSPDFQSGASIPQVFTCEGAGTSPALHIAGLPSGTQSLAIIVHDPDAGTKGFTHWVAWNLEPTLTDIVRDFKGGVQGSNGTGKPGYMGPCPPTGVHHYHFMVYALDAKLTIDPKTDKAGLEKAMAGHILSQGDLVGLYQKVNK
jgi:Raf kinase inhibitor-like YbhB/YbcL family protein